MFEIRRSENGDIVMRGGLQTAHAPEVRKLLASVTESCRVDLAELEYISSLGLGALLEAQKRLQKSGHGLTLINVSNHVRDLFQLVGFASIFDIR